VVSKTLDSSGLLVDLPPESCKFLDVSAAWAPGSHSQLIDLDWANWDLYIIDFVLVSVTMDLMFTHGGALYGTGHNGAGSIFNLGPAMAPFQHVVALSKSSTGWVCHLELTHFGNKSAQGLMTAKGNGMYYGFKLSLNPQSLLYVSSDPTDNGRVRFVGRRY
jgi:hypothetical protein